MATSALDVTPEEMAEYRATFVLRRAVAQARASEQKALARDLANTAAAALKRRFGATRVVLYGSLARGEFFLGSDIDIVAWGIDSARWLDVVGLSLDLGRDIPMSVALAQMMRPEVMREVLEDGVQL